MPRRRPGALRAARDLEPHRIASWQRDLPPIDRLSRTTSALVRNAEAARPGYHVHPGSVRTNLARYRAFLRLPGEKLRLPTSGCLSCPGCQYDDIAYVRDALQDALMLLPLPARTELRRLLDTLDTRFRRRTIPDRWSSRTDWLGESLPWWHRRVYTDVRGAE
ncbi:hypothetical protein GCM10010441_40860 [Kitasatospora paracochleata]|uniref:Uncharacterized protein n=1 Tax=Kitasatospora paracochleata TaxID=58354 RepID=A0ABT1IRK2_9ACTN|nr:hypothetical protein [Kitasatospora paracochleata]MCP2307573.1 hypothetical protein [Kitasatospora paracochleata]